MFNSDLTAASLLLGICTLTWARAMHFSPMGGVFVRFVIGILALLGFILLLKGLWLPEMVLVKGTGDYRLVLLVALLMTFYVALIPYLGFLVASILLFALTCWLLDRRAHAEKHFLRSCSAGIGLTLLFFFAFKYGLSVPLPMGVLWG
ncbi:MAG: tripartite tricarboxylate transporter TctB family protein [Firmicutes bacterium]|jgi:putative tricarboxylic transport membrane protein|nr:tripartite tricarboxylate transporter TctB family protein [Bacillota bacterium]